jgi:hypothetical protein
MLVMPANDSSAMRADQGTEWHRLISFDSAMDGLAVLELWSHAGKK